MTGPQEFSGWAFHTIKLIEAVKDKRILFNWFYENNSIVKEINKINFENISCVAVDTKVSLVGKKLRAIIFLNNVLCKYYNDLKSNIIYIPNAYYPAELIVVVAKLLRIPTIVRVCHKELTADTFKSKIRKHIISSYASKIILLNNNSYKQFKDKPNTLLIPNGVDTTVFTPCSIKKKRSLRKIMGYNENDKILLFVGSIVKRKGVDILLESLVKIVNNNNNVKLILAGPFDSSSSEVDSLFISKLYSLIKKNNLGVVVRFCGRVKNPVDYYQLSDIFVLPSYSEGMPNVLLEGMSSGLACISSNIPGVNDIIKNNHDGILIRPGSEEDLTREIEGLLQVRSKIKIIGDRARLKIVNNFSLNSTTNKYLEAFK